MAEHESGGEVIRYTTKEILAEIREGIHAVKATVLAHDRRITALELEVTESRKLRDKYVPIVDALVRDLDVKAQVQEALDERADSGFTRRQKLFALAVAISALGLQAFGVLHAYLT